MTHRSSRSPVRYSKAHSCSWASTDVCLTRDYKLFHFFVFPRSQLPWLHLRARVRILTNVLNVCRTMGKACHMMIFRTCLAEVSMLVRDVPIWTLIFEIRRPCGWGLKRQVDLFQLVDIVCRPSHFWMYLCWWGILSWKICPHWIIYWLYSAVWNKVRVEADPWEVWIRCQNGECIALCIYMATSVFVCQRF